jgi:hypothetical protein
MTSTQDPADVGSLDAHAAALTQLTLLARQSLPHAQNGRPVAPSDPYVVHVRRAMQAGLSSEYKRLYAVARCDLTDGVSCALVVAPLRRMIALLEADAVAQHRRTASRPLATLVRAETKAQCRTSLAALKLVEQPENPVVLDEAIRDARMQEETLGALALACEERRAALHVSRRRVYGARVSA